MEKEDYFIVLFAVILLTSLYYVYRNMSDFECFVETTIKNAMSDIKYEFEPEGSLFGKTKIYRFSITSSASNLEYFSMKITNGRGEVLFFEAGTEPAGGSIVKSLAISETDTISVERVFKKKCFPEVRL